MADNKLYILQIVMLLGYIFSVKGAFIRVINKHIFSMVIIICKKKLISLQLKPGLDGSLKITLLLPMNLFSV